MNPKIQFRTWLLSVIVIFIGLMVAVIGKYFLPTLNEMNKLFLIPIIISFPCVLSIVYFLTRNKILVKNRLWFIAHGFVRYLTPNGSNGTQLTIFSLVTSVLVIIFLFWARISVLTIVLLGCKNFFLACIIFKALLGISITFNILMNKFIKRLKRKNELVLLD